MTILSQSWGFDNLVFVDYNSIDRIENFPELVVIPDGWREVEMDVRHE